MYDYSVHKSNKSQQEDVTCACMVLLVFVADWNESLAGVWPLKLGYR